MFGRQRENLFSGEDLTQASEAKNAPIRGSEISMIFQEPMTALNPVIQSGGKLRGVQVSRGYAAP